MFYMGRIEMLTLEKLKKMKPGTVFAKGKLIDSPEGINLANTGNIVRWIAKRGHIPDWTIYAQNPHYGELHYGFDWVEAHGDKIFTEYSIKKLIKCDDTAFEMYRF